MRTTPLRADAVASRDRRAIAAGGGGLAAVPLAGLVVAAGAGAVAVAVAERTSYQLWGAMLVLPALALVSLPLLQRVARAEDDRGVTRLVVVALLVKMAASGARYVMAFGLYGGVADANAYGDRGAELAALFRQGDVSLDAARHVPGTGVLDVATGAVFTVTGATLLGAFLVFAWVAFWGQYLCYRAVRVGLPGSDHRRYALLVLFVPSLLFWPSSVGKESWMLFGLGLAAYGAARVFRGRFGGYHLLVAGSVWVGLVRPHMAALVAVSLLFALLLATSRDRARPPAAAFAAQLVGLVVVVAATAYALQQVQAFFEVESLQGLQGQVEQVANQTATGGSAFQPTQVRSLVDFPLGAVSVLFRPWPFEVHNAQALLASAEGLLLLALMVAGRQRLATAVREARARPYLLFALVFSVLFIVAFSYVGNFGILARQRVQLYPFVLVLLAIVPLRRPRPSDREPRRAADGRHGERVR